MTPATGITEIIYVDDLGTTPATVNRRTGTLYISKRIWKHLKPEHKFFIMLHEMGHVVLQSTDEKAVDEWAFYEYAKRGYSLEQSVYALSKLLNGRNREHGERVYLQLQRAKEYDYSHYGNKYAFGGRNMAAFAGKKNLKRQQMKDQKIKAIKERLRKAKANHNKRHINLRKRLSTMKVNHNARIKVAKGNIKQLDGEISALKARISEFIKKNPGRPIPKEVYFPNLPSVENNPYHAQGLSIPRSNPNVISPRIIAPSLNGEFQIKAPIK